MQGERLEATLNFGDSAEFQMIMDRTDAIRRRRKKGDNTEEEIRL